MKKQNSKKNNKNKMAVSSPDEGMRYQKISNQFRYLTRIPENRPIVPDRVFRRLCYEGMGPVTISTVATFNTLRFRPSAAYDVDPLLASTATPGFSELAALYSNYRVTVSKCEISIVSSSSSLGVQLCVIPLTDDPGASPSGTTVNSWPDQPYAKQKLCGLAGSPAIRVVNEMTTEKIFGSQEVYTDDTYESATNSTPLRNWYWAISVATGSIPTTAITCTMVFKITMGLEFYRRKELVQ
jgi:hypothetical protein